MSTKGNLFITQSLAASGLAVLDSTIACLARPDLWNSGMEAAGDFSSKFFHPIDRPGARRYQAHFEGKAGPVEVLARSDDRLALRLEWITGLRVEQLFAMDDFTRQPTTVSAALNSRDPGADLFAGVVTAEPGRSCGECDLMTVAGRCRKAAISGVEWPNRKASRRCPAFVALFDASDRRSGAELWPELRVVPSP